MGPGALGARARLCAFCRRPREPLYALPDGGVLIEVCCICWLTREIQQLSQRLPFHDSGRGAAEDFLNAVYRLLRESVRERVEAGELPAFPPAELDAHRR